MTCCSYAAEARSAVMKKGLHPVLRKATYVLRDGSSVELPSVFKHISPYFAQKVSLEAHTWSTAFPTLPASRGKQTSDRDQLAALLRLQVVQRTRGCSACCRT